MSDKASETLIIESDLLTSLEDMTSTISSLAQSIRGLAFQIYESDGFIENIVYDRGVEQ